jgi:iron complex outermembrane recepter protein
MRIAALLVSSALCALAAPVWAQDAAPQADETADAEQGEIIVTATRRSEALSEVPIAVSAV